METNKKILKIGVILVAALVVIGYIGVYLLTLEEPVVIKHYIEEEISLENYERPREVYLEFGYITNAADDRVVNRVLFPEYPGLDVEASEYGFHSGIMFFTNGQQATPGNISGRYSQRIVYLKFTFNEEYQDHDLIEITKADLYLSDGSKIQKDIGFIDFRFVKDGSEIIAPRSLSWSESQSESKSVVKEDIELIGIESEYLAMLQEGLNITVNRQDFQEIEGMEIREGKELFIKTDWEDSENDEDKILQMKLRPKIHFINKNGEEAYSRIPMIQSRLANYSFFEILQYLQQRGAL